MRVLPNQRDFIANENISFSEIKWVVVGISFGFYNLVGLLFVALRIFSDIIENVKFMLLAFWVGI